MNRRFSIAALVLMVGVLIFLDLFIPGNQHFEFTYSMLVILTIWMPRRNISQHAGILSSIIIIARYVILSQHTVDKDGLASLIIPLIFTWAFVYIVVIYKSELIKSKTINERLTAMFNNATEGIIVSNTRGEIVMINPQAEIMFGYLPGELNGCQIEQLVPHRHVADHIHYRNKYFSERHSRPMGHGSGLSGKRKDDSELPLEISLSTFKIKEELFIISFIIDITERRKHEASIEKAHEELERRVVERTQELALANTSLKSEMKERIQIEDALRNSERLYLAMANNFPNGYICILNRTFQYVFIDGKELQELGCTREQLEGTSLHDSPILKSDDELISRLTKVFDWKSTSFDVQHLENIYYITAVPLPDAKGFVNEILLVVRNVTEKRKSERKIFDALEHEKKLNDLKSKFVSIASHEFRTPLSTILSSVTLIEKYDKPEENGKKIKHIERIKSSVKNLTEILNDFLSLEKLEAGVIVTRPVSFDLAAFSSDLCEEMQTMALPGQRIIYHHDGNGQNVILDKQLLRNICINLINNAIKYSPEATPVEFTTHAGKEVIISIKDHGMGIPAEDQQHLFERFFRASNAITIQGTGLGLNIVNRYVKLMKGNMQFHSAEHVGSEFIVSVPQALEPEQI